jgi:hypothetical protein
MLKRCLAMIFVATLAISFVGCGIQNALGGKPVPPLGGYSKGVIIPFEIKKPTGQYADLPTLLAYGAGTKFSIKLKDKSWEYDQSRDMKPVTSKMSELGISQNGIFQNTEAAVKLGKAFDADIVVVGLITEPKFTIERSGKITEDMSKKTKSGAARYYTVTQKALLRVSLKIIEVKSSDVIWTGDILGYKTYQTQYLTGESEKSQREETMYADIRKTWVDNFVTKLYPETAVVAETTK